MPYFVNFFDIPESNWFFFMFSIEIIEYFSFPTINFKDAIGCDFDTFCSKNFKISIVSFPFYLLIVIACVGGSSFDIKTTSHYLDKIIFDIHTSSLHSVNVSFGVYT